MLHTRFRRITAFFLCLLLLFSFPCPARAAREKVNILLVGLDRRPGEESCRSDTILLCSYAPDSGELVLISFLRDLYLPIPGHGSNRLNAAYALGGPELLQKTLEETFSLKTQGYVEVDFSQFSGIIDALGGVTLELREDEAALINQSCGASLTQGLQQLHSDQVLCYTRIRKLDSDGDFSRTLRQQNVIRAILEKWKDADLVTMLKAARVMLPLISTDLSPGQILNWILSASPSMSSLQIRGLRIPAEGTYSYTRINGMDVLTADIEKNNELVHKNS